MSAFDPKRTCGTGTAICPLITDPRKEHRLQADLRERRMRRIATIGSILLVAMSIARLGCDSASAQTADDVAKRFVGMWSLVSITTNGHPDRGPHPSGFIVYDRSGNMTVQVMPDRNRPKYADAQPTPDDAQAGTVTHHRKGNINPGASIEV